MLKITVALLVLGAMERQQQTAEQIVRQGGDYVLALKGNQARLETRYFISCLSVDDLYRLTQAVCAHWAICVRCLRRSSQSYRLE